ncbi:unnamed protein product [Adineta ricciae]|uniref:SCP domain-containing protein n=1 Tax=Adineta ricciae TaxID=249248 RepID=A0A814QJ85_ADIRI|nr:unnamed protein product [Adineta ricciae]CAF1216053.1 unnamed protein product [Adineta ricciae]
MTNLNAQRDTMQVPSIFGTKEAMIGVGAFLCLALVSIPVVLVVSLVPLYLSNNAVDGTKSSSSSTSLTTFEQQALDATNTYRTSHCAPALTYDQNLKKIAQTYAQKLCDTNTFAHSGNTYQGQALGENLWQISSSSPMTTSSLNGADPVAAWYSEISSYNFASPGFSSATGHFTQLVWKSTTSFGIGVCCTSAGTTCIAVANYISAGNVAGQFPQNVLPTSCSG